MTPTAHPGTSALARTVLGTGLPVTVFAHGIGGSAAETRPLAARAPGTRVLLDFRGHGDSPALPGGWDYDALADDLLQVADEVGATGAVGLSLGSGALLRAVSRRPGRFERLAFVLPAALHVASAPAADVRVAQLRAAIDAADEARIAELLLEEVPPRLRERTGAGLLIGRRARSLATRRPPPPRDARALPLHSLEVLRAVTAPTLVIGQAEDHVHPLHLATVLADALPAGRLLSLPPGGLFWTATRQAQDALAEHLSLEVPCVT